jgi:hypothetical protein
MENNNIGISLLFYREIEQGVEGLLKSYIYNYQKGNDIQEVILNTYKSITHNNISYSLLGINDLFKVTRNFEENAILGKITFNEIKTKDKAQKLALQQKDYPFSEEESIGASFFLCSLIFFYEGESYYTFTLLTLIRASSIREANQKILLNMKKKEFIRNLEDFFCNNVDFLKKIKFIDFEFISPIFDEEVKENCFQVFYCDFPSKEKLLKGNIIKKATLMKKIKLLLEQQP